MTNSRFPTPAFDGVIIAPDPVVEEVGGVLLPEDSQDKPLTGTVAAIGKGKQANDTGVWIEVQVEVGDRILYKRFNTGAAIKINDSDYYLIPQTEILLIN